MIETIHRLKKNAEACRKEAKQFGDLQRQLTEKAIAYEEAHSYLVSEFSLKNRKQENELRGNSAYDHVGREIFAGKDECNDANVAQCPPPIRSPRD